MKGAPMIFDRENFLSFIIRPTGEVIAAMPHEEEFSVQQIREHVVGHPEVICETCEGFLLFCNRDANTAELPVNSLATSVCAKYRGGPCAVKGHVFAAHPKHVAPYWRRKLQTEASTTNSKRASA